MTATPPPLGEQVDRDLQIVPATAFYRVAQRDFGVPGLVAIESIGPFVELASVGPFLMIHDAYMEPGMGIDHHPHRTNERLFYILRGRIEHDDALNGIQGTMEEGDLARLTEGERGMLHREWNGRQDVTTHAFILVYTPDVDPPIPTASFNALRAADRVRVRETDAVETLHLIGGGSDFRASNTAITGFADSSLAAGARLDVRMESHQGLILYPVEGTLHLRAGDEAALLPATTHVLPEGPDAMAIAWSEDGIRSLTLEALDGPARVLRVAFARGDDDLVLHQPWRSRS